MWVVENVPWFTEGRIGVKVLAVRTDAVEKESSVSGHRRDEDERWEERVKIKYRPNK
jgi:hypothetical protein